MSKPPTQNPVSEAEQLCLHCGLCCDGTLFDSVPLREEEKRALPMLAQANASLSQPCAALRSDKCCAVYASRPIACRWFRCLLLEAMQAKEVSLKQARDIVDDTHRQLDDVRRWLPLQPGRSVMQQALAETAAQSESQFEAVSALRKRLRFYFVGQKRAF
jgi:uncharacterized protein